VGETHLMELVVGPLEASNLRLLKVSLNSSVVLLTNDIVKAVVRAGWDDNRSRWGDTAPWQASYRALMVSQIFYLP
jgi:hypothetical protein